MSDKQHPILIVEDDVEIREAMSELLESRGYAVSVARHGAEALEQLRAGSRPCIILLDLMMPVMDGWTFCQETERDPAFAAIPILIVSAVTRLDPRTAHVRSVAQLSKPLNFDDLLAALAVHC
jgi:CheY-like chemotaxis protein